MKKEGSTIKDIFNSIVEEKNEEATREINSRKFGVTKITKENVRQLSSFELDESREESLKP